MRQQPSGFTLVELLVVVAVFSMTSLIATSIFLLSGKGSRQTAQSQKIQGDVRFALEAVAREFRFGTIDYTCYNQIGQSCDPENLGTEIDLDFLKGKTNILAMRDLDGNRIRYKAMVPSGGTVKKLEVCFITNGTDPANKCDVTSNWEVVTPQDVTILQAYFYIYPFFDPFKLKDDYTLPPAAGYPYAASSQPRATIVFQSTQSATESSPEHISAQTTAVSRFYAR